MQTQIKPKPRVLITALALLLLAAAFVGYQAVSAQISPGTLGDPPGAPTGLTAEPVDGLVHLNWDALGDDSVTDIHVSRTVDGEEAGGHWHANCMQTTTV